MSETVKGLKKLIETLKKFPPEMNDKLDRQVELSAGDIVRDAQVNCPVDIGDLRQSIGAEKIDDMTYRVATNMTKEAPYGPYVEYGTGPHVIRPKKPGGTLRFKINGDWVFAKEVNHPGTRAQPFFFPAVMRGRVNFQKELERLLDKEVKKI